MSQEIIEGIRTIEREKGIEAGTLELARAASRPLVAALAVALLVAMFMKETEPQRRS